MLRIENSLVPKSARQLAVDATCAPMKTPVGLLRSPFRSHPACSQLSHAQPRSIRICGSMYAISLRDTPKRLGSIRCSPWSRISPSYALPKRPGPEKPADRLVAPAVAGGHRFPNHLAVAEEAPEVVVRTDAAGHAVCISDNGCGVGGAHEAAPASARPAQVRCRPDADG